MWEKKKIILSIAAISFIQGLQYCVSPVLGDIAAYYKGVRVDLIQMLITAPALISVVIALVSGGLVLVIAKKDLLLAASLVAGITGVIPLFADGFYILFGCRVVFGISLGLATTLNTAVVADFFTGKERVTAMGIQGACVGLGMVAVNTIGGILGQGGFRQAYWINVIGFISFFVILFCLPRTRRGEKRERQKLVIGKPVYIMAAFSFLEFFFLIAFSTNIAMHLQGSLAGSSAAAGYLTGIFSGIQIVAGFVLGYITKVFKKQTATAAMISFSLGAVLLVAGPSSFPLLAAGAALCGISQGVFIPTGMVFVANAVPPISAAMASALYTCGMCIGQFLSPIIVNQTAGLLFGEVTTTYVYIVCAAGMLLSAAGMFFWQRKIGRTEINAAA